MQQELQEMKASTRDSERLMRKWESLTSQAQHIPTVSVEYIQHLAGTVINCTKLHAQYVTVSA